MSSFQECASLGQTAFHRGDMAEAERLFREALVYKPGSIGATRGLGFALVNQKKFADAEPVWRKAVEIEPQSAENQQVLGSVYLVNRKLGPAAAHLKRALEIQPDFDGVALKMAHICYVNRDYAGAADYYMKAHLRDPFHIEALKGAVQALIDTRREAEAVAVGLKGVAQLRARADIPPVDYAAVYMIMGDAYKALNDVPRAQDCYRAVIADNPDDDVARHLLAASEGRLTEDHVKGFAKNVFDALAGTFDKRLVELLKYRSPEILAAGLREINPGVTRYENVLDLGCGTGLMVQALKQGFEVGRAIGVDLSPNMVQEAAKRGIYDELICGDVADALRARHEQFDLIIAADVFIYVGELGPVHALAQQRLAPGGIFAFTAEASDGEGLELMAHGHYRHGKAYLLQLAAAHGFTVAKAEEAAMRKERGKDVMGYYVYLRA